MWFEWMLCNRKVAQLRVSQGSQAAPPHCPALSPALQPPATRARIPPLSRASCPCYPHPNSCGSHGTALIPIFLLISLAQPALSKMGWGLDVTLPPPGT